MASINMENDNNFDILIIKPNKINDISWLDLDYSKKLMNLDIYEIYTTNKNNFENMIYTKLNISSFNIPNLTIKNEIIGEEPYYIYELLYIDTNTTNNINYENEDNINELATLLNINEDKIYNNVIILKTYISSLSDSMLFESITKNNIQLLLHNRVNTKIVIWDWTNGWKEEEIIGDLTTYINILFEGDNYNQININFLMHDINIWYVEDKYGDKVCGNILNKPLEKCIWFTMKSEDYRGNLTLDEVNKIIKLSLHLENYNIPDEFNIDKYDKYNRQIIYNKYKILDSMYDKYK